MLRDFCLLTVLFTIPTVVELSIWMGVGGCGWPSSSKVSHMTLASFALRNNAPSSEDVNCTVEFDGFAVDWDGAEEEKSRRSAFCVCSAEIRCIRVHIQNHIGCIISDLRIGMGPHVVHELLASF